MPPSDSAAFIHGLRRLPGTRALFRVREPTDRTIRRPKKGCNTIEGGRARDGGRRDGKRREREREKERRERTEERIARTGYGRGREGQRRSEKEHTVIYSRGTREINGSRNRQKPVRGQKTRCRHRLNRHRAIQGVKRKGEKEKKESYRRSAETREGERMEERLTQEEEKGSGDSDEAGNLPPILKSLLRDLKFAM